MGGGIQFDPRDPRDTGLHLMKVLPEQIGRDSRPHPKHQLLSFLGRLTGYEVRGGVLTLQQ